MTRPMVVEPAASGVIAPINIAEIVVDALYRPPRHHWRAGQLGDDCQRLLDIVKLAALAASGPKSWYPNNFHKKSRPSTLASIL